MGKWKLISKADKRQSFKWDKFADLPPGAWELFDMEADRTETNDLSKANSDVVNKLSAMWHAWAEQVGAIPRPN